MKSRSFRKKQEEIFLWLNMRLINIVRILRCFRLANSLIRRYSSVFTYNLVAERKLCETKKYLYGAERKEQ